MKQGNVTKRNVMFSLVGSKGSRAARSVTTTRALEEERNEIVSQRSQVKSEAARNCTKISPERRNRTTER